MFIPAAFAAIGGAVTAGIGAASAAVAGGLVSLGASFGVAGAIGQAIYAGGVAIGGTIAALGGKAGVGAFVKAAMTVASLASMVVSTPQISGASGQALDFKADPYAGIPYLIGRSATGGNAVAQRTSNDGKGEYLHNFVVLTGAGPIDSIESFTADDVAVTYTAGKANSGSGPYKDLMWSARTLGPTTGWTLGQPAGTGVVAEWTGAHKASGYAVDRWILKTDQNAYPSMPKPRWVGKWVKVYDPRLDSTYPGGAGPQRWVDPRVDPAGHAAAKATWTWSENPHIHALNWKLARWDRDESNSAAKYTLILGLGTPPAGIDIAAFVEAANIADANGWTISGSATSRDSKAEVERAMMQAGGAVPLRKAALQSLLISTPRVSLATLTAADFSGEISIAAAVPAREKVNQITPSFVSEAHKWEVVPAAPVKVDSLVTAAGRLRPRGITYPFVNDATQASQLALYACYDSFEFGPVTLPLMPRWMHLAAGDVITVHDADIGFATPQDLLILERTTDPQTGADVAICRSETVAKHAAALGQSGVAPPIPGLTGVDPRNIPAPAVAAWSLTGGSEAIGAALVPTLHLTGATDNGAASSVVLALSLDGVTPVSSLGEHPAAFTGKNITEGVGPNTAYYVLIAYKVMGVQGAWRAYGPAMTGDASAPSAGEVPWDGVTDPGGTRPEDNATVGGTIGEDIRDPEGNVLPREEVITSEGTSNNTENVGDKTAEEVVNELVDLQAALGSAISAGAALDAVNAAKAIVEDDAAQVAADRLAVAGDKTTAVNAKNDAVLAKEGTEELYAGTATLQEQTATLYKGVVMVGGNQGFEDELVGWSTLGAIQPIPPTMAGWLASTSGKANVLVTAAGLQVQIMTEKVWPVDPARRYRIRGDFAAGINGFNTREYIGIACVDEDGDFVGANSGLIYVAGSGAVRPAAWYSLQGQITGETDTADAGAFVEYGYPDADTGFRLGTKGVRLIALLNYDAVAGAQAFLDGIWIEDVTESYKANVEAQASLTQAGIATTKAGEASLSATAAALSEAQALILKGDVQGIADAVELVAAQVDLDASSAVAAKNLAAAYLGDMKARNGNGYFLDGNEGWFEGSYLGGPAVLTSAVDVTATGGKLARTGTGLQSQMFSGLIPVDPSRPIRIKARFRVKGPGTSLMYVGFAGYDGTGTLVDHGAYGSFRYAVTSGANYVEADGWRTFDVLVSGTGNNAYGKFPPGTTQISLCGLGNWASTAGTYVEWDYLYMVPADTDAVDALAWVTENSGAFADVQGKTAAWLEQVVNAGSDATAFVALKAESSPGVDFSSVAMGAEEVHILNKVNGQYKKTMSVVGGNVVINGNVSASAFIVLDSGTNWPLARGSKTFVVADGTPITYPLLDSVPDFELSDVGLAPLAPGEVYSRTIESPTRTGGTVRLKIITPTSDPTPRTITGDADGATVGFGGGSRAIDVSGYPDAVGGIFTVEVTVTASFDQPPYADLDYSETIYVGIWKKVGGVVIYAGSIPVYLTGTMYGGYGSVSTTVQENFNLGAGVTHVAADIQYGYGYGTWSLDTLNSVTFTEPGASSGIRSATPSGQTTTLTVRPKS